jgi:phage major head subunit gpT-like protein
MALNTAKYEVVLNSLTAKFNQAAAAATPFYPEVCYIHPSSRLTEQFGMLGSMPGVREWLGDRKFQELRAMDFSISNKLWEMSIDIPKTNVDDDHMGLYGPVMQNMAIEATYHPDELLLSTLIANGATTTCWDTQYFFDSDHSWGDSGSQSNVLTPTCVSASAVTATEFGNAFDAARIKMLQYKSDSGKYFNRTIINRMSDLLILCSPELERAARTAFQAQILSNSSVVNVDVPQIRSTPLITSSAVWYLFNLASPLKPFIFQAREPLHTMTKGADDLEEKDLKFMTQARYNIGYFAWWNAIKNTMTAA